MISKNVETMKIAILGATSQIARDLILSFSAEKGKQLHLFARRPAKVMQWLNDVGLPEHYPVDDFSLFSALEFDAVINFVGAGDPTQIVTMGSAIFEITFRFDEMVLDYLKSHPECRYLFLSSGAAYGSNFNEPATCETPAIIAINNLVSHEMYGVAKLYAECRHRSHPELQIIDIRVFNYFSQTQDINARFLITDILRAIRDKTILKTSSDNIKRDYLHPSDFYQLICSILSGPPTNIALDCYSRAPIDKLNLLATMHERFGLSYEITETNIAVNATGSKSHYYSLNKRASDFGYLPTLTSLDGVMQESEKILMPLMENVL